MLKIWCFFVTLSLSIFAQNSESESKIILHPFQIVQWALTTVADYFKIGPRGKLILGTERYVVHQQRHGKLGAVTTSQEIPENVILTDTPVYRMLYHVPNPDQSYHRTSIQLVRVNGPQALYKEPISYEKLDGLYLKLHALDLKDESMVQAIFKILQTAKKTNPLECKALINRIVSWESIALTQHMPGLLKKSISEDKWIADTMMRCPALVNWGKSEKGFHVMSVLDFIRTIDLSQGLAHIVAVITQEQAPILLETMIDEEKYFLPQRWFEKSPVPFLPSLMDKLKTADLTQVMGRVVFQKGYEVLRIFSQEPFFSRLT
jgi:hypothetical protein